MTKINKNSQELLEAIGLAFVELLNSQTFKLHDSSQ